LLRDGVIRRTGRTRGTRYWLASEA